MPGKNPGPSVKRPRQYEALKDKGLSKESAARISNAQAKEANGGKTPTKKQAASELAARKKRRS